MIASEQTEKLYVIRDQHAALATIIADEGMIEIAVKCAECIGLAYDGSVNHWVVIGVGRHNTGSRARETTSETSFACR